MLLPETSSAGSKGFYWAIFSSNRITPPWSFVLDIIDVEVKYSYLYTYLGKQSYLVLYMIMYFILYYPYLDYNIILTGHVVLSRIVHLTDWVLINLCY